MKPRGRWVLIGTLAALAISASLTISPDFGRVVREHPAPAATSANLAELLDPRNVKLHLCGGNAEKRGLFFRPGFRLHLARPVQAAEDSGTGPVLWDDLGDYTFPVTTESPGAQAFFDQGFRLSYAFNHWEAVRAFRRAQEIDPGCAMCYWGEAYALGPNINLPMQPEAVEPAFAAVAKAQALASSASDKERDLIAALAARYSPDPKADRDALDAAYAAAMRGLHEKYPEDHDIAAMYAEAVMDTQPWDYWERDFKTPKGMIGEAIEAIEGVLAQNPRHPGAIHFYIHLMEASAMPEKAEPYADNLGPLMPGAGHLVHMPSHIYFRVGRYLDSLEANIAAARADKAYLATRKGSDIYRYGYYPHNVHFVLVSAQMAGDGATALEFATELDSILPLESAAQAAWIAPIKAAPLFARLQFGDYDDVLAIPDPGDSVPYVKAAWHYVRGVALAQSGQGDAAAAEADHIRALNRPELMQTLDENGVPGGDLLRIAETVVRARIAQAAEDYETAIAMIEDAVALQDGLIYSEPPFWYYPVRQTLGVVYLQAGRTDDAIAAFTGSLVQHPNNAWSLYGLMKAQEAAGDSALDVTRKLYRETAVEDANVAMERL